MDVAKIIFDQFIKDASLKECVEILCEIINKIDNSISYIDENQYKTSEMSSMSCGITRAIYQLATCNSHLKSKTFKK